MEIVYSREYLQDLPAKYRADHVANIINTHVNQILSAARNGSTSYVFRSFTHDPNSGLKYSIIPTPDELVAMFKAKFPHCHVEYTEIWEEVRLGVKEQRRMIKIDWS